jgi:hypothetical protein
MFGGLNRLLAAAVVAGAVLVLPPAALADCGGGPSAVNVYKECLSSGGGGKATSHSGGSKSSGTNASGGGSTSSTGGSTSSTSVPVSHQTQKALKKAGTDGKALSNLVKGYGAARILQSSSSDATEPSAVGSAFDLGSGPTALLIVLALTAVLLLGATGFRSVRQRRH